MKVQVLLVLLAVVSGAAAQNESVDQNETDLPDASEEVFDLRLAISAAAVVFLVVAFVFMARR